MSVRTKLIEWLGGVDDDEPTAIRTGDVCVDEGHDVQEIRSATSPEPIARRCRRCQLWLDAKGNPK
jgi:hypothetical protein